MNRSISAIILPLLVFAPALTPVSAQPNAADREVRKLIEKVDELYRSKSSYAEVEMRIVTPNWERTLRLKAWTEGMDKTFIRIIAPEKEKGMATLRIGAEMWNYLPKVNKTMKIPPSMMMGDWMGSDFTNDDLVKEYTFLDDYTFKAAVPEDARDDLVYADCVPREGRPIVWGHVTIAVRKSDYLPVWERFYDERNNLMRIMNFKEIKTFGNRSMPSVLELVPTNKEGNKTVLTYLDARFDVDLGGDVFSLRNLRAGD